MANNFGFIKLNRKIVKNKIWHWETFSRGQAWIDLLLIAEYSDGEFYSKRGLIKYKRGECLYSLSDLAERWGWSRHKVRVFLATLEEQKMIKRRLEKRTYSIITILNYSQYQDKEKSTTAKGNKKDNDDFDYEGHLKFLLGDRYEEYMDCKAKGIEFHE